MRAKTHPRVCRSRHLVGPLHMQVGPRHVMLLAQQRDRPDNRARQALPTPGWRDPHRVDPGPPRVDRHTRDGHGRRPTRRRPPPPPPDPRLHRLRNDASAWCACRAPANAAPQSGVNRGRRPSARGSIRSAAGRGYSEAGSPTPRNVTRRAYRPRHRPVRQQPVTTLAGRGGVAHPAGGGSDVAAPAVVGSPGGTQAAVREQVLAPVARPLSPPDGHAGNVMVRGSGRFSWPSSGGMSSRPGLHLGGYPSSPEDRSP